MSNNLIDVQQMKHLYNTEKQMIKLVQATRAPYRLY